MPIGKERVHNASDNGKLHDPSTLPLAVVMAGVLIYWTITWQFVLLHTSRDPETASLEKFQMNQLR